MAGSARKHMSTSRQPIAASRRDWLAPESSDARGVEPAPADDGGSRGASPEGSEAPGEGARQDRARGGEAGEPLTVSLYKQRFPEHAEAIEQACFARPEAGGVP